MEYFEINLVQTGIKKLINTKMIIGVCFDVILVVIYYFLFGASGLFDDLKMAIGFSIFGIALLAANLTPFHSSKVSQSTIRFYDNHVSILDKKGNCWRSINYSEITSIQTREVEGFFYGVGKDDVVNKYICVFLNGINEIPNISYKKLFTHKDFFMFFYNEEAYQYLYERIMFNKASCEGEPQHYFCPICNSDIKFGIDKCDKCGEVFDWSINK